LRLAERNLPWRFVPFLFWRDVPKENIPSLFEATSIGASRLRPWRNGETSNAALRWSWIDC
jgi:hypothetical protein